MRWFFLHFSLLAMHVYQSRGADLTGNERSPTHSNYTVGVIPALAFDADLGVKYGAVVNLFDHGPGGEAPHYNQHLFVRLTNTTKGSLTAQALLESETLLNQARLLAEVSYIRDKQMDFYGFNGRNAVFHEDFTIMGSESYIQRSYYAHERSLLRLRLDAQHHLSGERLRLLTGFQHNRFQIEPINHSEASETLAVDDAYRDWPSLFHKYLQWGIIPDKDKAGGAVNAVSLGLIYDTRNDHCYCTDGLWLDGFVVMAPGFLGKHSFAKLILTYRQHISFFNERLVLSLRGSSQQKLYGEIPFYMLPTHFDSRLSQDGLGGAFNLRGAMRNRIVSDGFVLGNLETKFKLMDFYLLRQYFYTSAALFIDMAYVTQPFDADLSSVPDDFKTRYFNNKAQRIHHTFGPGLYIVFNKNNIITINYGLTTNRQDGMGGLYIGSSLLF
jgi:outer membrane protein assembly factor BamA